MTNKRNLSPTHLELRRDSQEIAQVPRVNKAARMEDVVILRTAPNNEPARRMQSVPVASAFTPESGGSTSSRISYRTNLTSISSLEPFLSSVPTSSLQSDSSPNLGSLLSFLGQDFSNVSRL